MPDYSDIPISSFPDAQSVDASDKVTGLKNGSNTNFSFNSILAWLISQFYAVFLPASSKGAAGGVASLDSTGKIPSDQMPIITESVTATTNAQGRLSTSLQTTNAIILAAMTNTYFCSVYVDNNVQGIEVRDLSGDVVANTSVTVTLVVLYV